MRILKDLQLEFPTEMNDKDSGEGDNDQNEWQIWQRRAERRGGSQQTSPRAGISSHFKLPRQVKFKC